MLVNIIIIGPYGQEYLNITNQFHFEMLTFKANQEEKQSDKGNKVAFPLNVSFASNSDR
jgi:hypothetical protein